MNIHTYVLVNMNANSLDIFPCMFQILPVTMQFYVICIIVTIVTSMLNDVE